MKYKYVGGVDGDQFVQGLPTSDLDDTDLGQIQRLVLQDSVIRGIYAPIEDAAVQTTKKDIPVYVKPGTQGAAGASQETGKADEH